MKLLLDLNISYRVAKSLEEIFPEVTQVGRLGLGQTDDAMIWQYALVNNYAIVTLDEYFQNRNLVAGNPMKIIWIRRESITTAQIIDIFYKNQDFIKKFLESGDDTYMCLELY